MKFKRQIMERILLMKFGGHHFKLASLVLLMSWSAAALAAERCVGEVAAHYGINSQILEAILRVEGGSVGLRRANTNGTYDLGPMQINTLWLPVLRARGVDAHLLQWNYCANVAVGAWILATHIKSAGAAIGTPEFWQAVGRYHSNTPIHNTQYALRVWHQIRVKK